MTHNKKKTRGCVGICEVAFHHTDSIHLHTWSHLSLKTNELSLKKNELSFKYGAPFVTCTLLSTEAILWRQKSKM